MKEISKNRKIVYALIVIIILVGIVMLSTLKLNISTTYGDNTRIKIYLDKEYNLDDIKKIAEEVFATKDIVYQEVEVFKESVSITVKEVTDEQIESLTSKLQEKYEIESLEGLVQTNQIAHIRLRDIIKPYILPIAITTVIILVYVAIIYRKLGVVKAVFILLIRMVIAEALLISIIAITRIPVGAYVMPIAIGIYLIVIIYTLIEYQNKREKSHLEEKK